MSDEQFEALARRTITQPGYTVASDGIYHGVLPHPRGYGTFTRFLRVWVRERGVLSLEDAIRRMTGGVADRYRVRDRGRVAEGLAADLVVFDPATISDHATWEQPRERPTGVDAVLVNGRVVIAGGRADRRVARTRGAPGRPMTHRAARLASPDRPMFGTLSTRPSVRERGATMMCRPRGLDVSSARVTWR